MAARRARAKEIAGRLNEAWNASEIGGVRKLSDAVRNHMGGLGLDPAGTSYGTVRSYTTGAVLKPRREVLDAIASVLGVRAEWLKTGNGYRTEHDEELALQQSVEVEWLGDDWGLMADLYHRIRQNCLLPNLSPSVRALFWEAHRRLGASSLVDGDEDGLYKIAQWIDVWVQEPTHWYDSPNVTEPQILNYYVSALNALALLGSMATRANVPAILPMPKEQE